MCGANTHEDCVLEGFYIETVQVLFLFIHEDVLGLANIQVGLNWVVSEHFVLSVFKAGVVIAHSALDDDVESLVKIVHFYSLIQLHYLNIVQNALLLHFQFLLQNASDHQLDSCLGSQRNVSLDQDGQPLNQGI